MLFILMWAKFCAGNIGLEEMKLQIKVINQNLLCFEHSSAHGLLERHPSIHLPCLFCFTGKRIRDI